MPAPLPCLPLRGEKLKAPDVFVSSETSLAVDLPLGQSGPWGANGISRRGFFRLSGADKLSTNQVGIGLNRIDVEPSTLVVTPSLGETITMTAHLRRTTGSDHARCFRRLHGYQANRSPIGLFAARSRRKKFSGRYDLVRVTLKKALLLGV